jgi:hypothetical protein
LHSLCILCSLHPMFSSQRLFALSDLHFLSDSDI